MSKPKQVLRQREGLPPQLLDVVKEHEDGSLDLAYPGAEKVIIEKAVPGSFVPHDLEKAKAPPVKGGKGGKAKPDAKETDDDKGDGGAGDEDKGDGSGSGSAGEN